MLSLPVQQRFREFIRPEIAQFLKQLRYKIDFDLDRIVVWADVEAYKWREDKLVYDQHKGNRPNTYQVFVDGVFVCYLNDNTPKHQTLTDFWRGFLKAYSLDDEDDGKIFIEKQLYEERKKRRKEKEKKQNEQILKAIQDKPVKSEVQEKAKEIALDVAKESLSTTN
jgi:hypothetical protein